MKRIACLALVLIGCGDTVPVVLNFPSFDTFVRSETARILVVDTDGDAGVCPDLLSQAELGVLDSVAVRDTGPQSVCEFQAGRVSLNGAPEGVRAYVAVAEDSSGVALLTGCTISDVHVDAAPLEIVMAPTDEYRTQFGAGSPEAMCTPEAKCQRGCREE
ncbi:MAG: hypothetical protein AAGE52_17995 [Myxococcota bacterium]